ncbi:hypothetical protein Tco_0308043 [Tanacetum coccineum]
MFKVQLPYLPDTLTNQAMKESDAYKTYLDFATGKVIPKPKYVRRSTKEKTEQAPIASPGKRLKAIAKVAKSGKKKLLHKDWRLYQKLHCANERTGVSPGVPDVPTYGSEDEQISWKSYISDEDHIDDDNVSLVTAVNINLEKKSDEERRKERKKKVSSISSGFISNMLNPNPNTSIDSILNLNTESTSLVDVPVTNNAEMPPSSKCKALDDDFSKFKANTNLFAYKCFISPSGLFDDNYLANKMNEAVKAAVQLHDDDEDEEPSAGSNRGSKRRRARKEPESSSAPKEKTSKSTGKSKEGSRSHQAEEPTHTVEDLEEPAHQEFNTGFTEDQPVDETTQLPNWFQKPAKPPTPDHD